MRTLVLTLAAFLPATARADEAEPPATVTPAPTAPKTPAPTATEPAVTLRSGRVVCTLGDTTGLIGQRM